MVMEGCIQCLFFHLNRMQKNPTQIPLVRTLLGGWRIVWELCSFHLLCVLCHRNLLLHFNDKVLEPLTPYAPFLLVILWSPRAETPHLPHHPPSQLFSNWPYEWLQNTHSASLPEGPKFKPLLNLRLFLQLNGKRD